MIMLIDLNLVWLTRLGPYLEFLGVFARGQKRTSRWT